jgi:DNA helicase-2/ATP-dependent DNA helicase PcrA
MCAFPSKDQEHVINVGGRALVVVAAPGTGKTATVVERMIRLLRENPKRVVSFMTFTRTSRRDTDRKLRETVDRKAMEIAEDDLPRISTLHTFAKRLVHRFAPTGREPDFTVLGRQSEKRILVSEAAEDTGVDVDLDDLEAAITRFRSTGDWPDQPRLTASQRVEIIRAFQCLLSFYNTFDWEGLVLVGCDILSRGASDLPPVFLQVDEYQDLNPKDQELVQLARATPSSQVVVVGDDAQSIYGMRHAHPAGIRELWDSEDWHTIHFRECHRLPPHILRAAHSLIKDKGYLGADITVPDDDGRRLETLQCTMSNMQIGAVAQQIRSLMESGRKSDGIPLTYHDFMVLCPTGRQVNQVAGELDDKYGIPTKQKRSGSIPDNVWKLLLVLRMLINRDSLAMRQWLEVIGLSGPDIRAIRMNAMASGRTLYEHCYVLDDQRIADVFRALEGLRVTLVDALQFRQALCDFPSLVTGEDVRLVIDEIIQHVPSVGIMIRHIYEKYGVVDEEDPVTESADISDEDRALVTTMHSAKGLEAEFVFITWLNARYMPMRGRNRDEEQRVLYVALTRAKQDVILTFHETFEGGRRLREEAMSPFLRSIRDHLNVVRVTASDLEARSFV